MTNLWIIKIKRLTFVIITSVFLILLTWCSHKDSKNISKNPERHFAIIPHFMLNSEKVDNFYQLNKESYYKSQNPDYILLISPNHFHQNIKKPQTICKTSITNFKWKNALLSNLLISLWISCDDKKIFYSRWESIKTNEHGIWEHFQRINTYFSWTQILPLIMPTHTFTNINSLTVNLKNLTWNILVIASVDFAHYQPETQTLQHDQQSIKILEEWDNKLSDFINNIDADCPTCLYTIQTLAKIKWQKAELRRRDSSSTILQQDMWKDNTSRIFMLYK